MEGDGDAAAGADREGADVEAGAHSLAVACHLLEELGRRVTQASKRFHGEEGERGARCNTRAISASRQAHSCVLCAACELSCV